MFYEYESTHLNVIIVSRVMVCLSLTLSNNVIVLHFLKALAGRIGLRGKFVRVGS